MVYRVGLLSGAPEEFGPLVADRGWQEDCGVEIALVIGTGTGGSDRLRTLRSRVRRQARINGTRVSSQFLAAVLYRRFVEPPLDFDTAWTAGLHVGLEIDSVDDPELVDAVRSSRLDALVIMNCGVLRQRVIDAIGVPVFNVHDGDPTVMRGRPPFFWDLREGRDHTTITVHRVVASVDAGEVVTQVELPLARRRSLRATMLDAELAARAARQQVLRRALAELASGTARPVAVEPGPLRTLPSLADLWAEARACRSHRAVAGPQPSSPQ